MLDRRRRTAKILQFLHQSFQNDKFQSNLLNKHCILGKKESKLSKHHNRPVFFKKKLNTGLGKWKWEGDYKAGNQTLTNVVKVRVVNPPTELLIFLTQTCFKIEEENTFKCQEQHREKLIFLRIHWCVLLNICIPAKVLHFNTSICLLIAGDWELLTYKAAVACYLYGREFKYVVKARECLEGDPINKNLYSILCMHANSCTGFYFNVKK